MQRHLIGLDIGGTSTRGVLFHGDRPVREARAGSANVQNVSRAQATTALRDVLRELAAPPSTPVLAGAGGVDTPADAAALGELIRHAGGYAPDLPVTAVHDTRLILAAGGHTTGMALIAGTGSVAWGVNAAGVQRRAGGWGYLLGDEGSGYWLGREAVRLVLRRDQAGCPADALARAVLDHADVAEPTELIAAFHERPERTFWAGLAAVVTHCAADGDRAADALVTDAAGELVTLLATVAEDLGPGLPVVMGGGLARSVVGERVCAMWVARTGDTPEVLTREPVSGAPLLAVTLGEVQPEG